MNKYIFYLLFCCFLFNNFAKSSLFFEILDENTVQHPVAARLSSELRMPNNGKIEASMRSGRSSKRKSLGLLSPSHLTPVKIERRALSELTNYIGDRVPSKKNPNPVVTPLNAGAVLRKATSIEIGAVGGHFESCEFFAHKVDKNEQLVLQAHISPLKKDARGRTNLERLKLGYSPLGADDKPIQLHHLTQQDGVLAEITQSTHNKYHGKLHYNLKSGTSKIDRKTFDRFRRAYWKNRGIKLNQALTKYQALKKKLF
ncbi:MAG: HNH/ENDO VII family nuclease [Alphaproteobacteria bacterium]